MRNHTLMQTIARANRVWGEKNNGLIVDYVGVFRNLQQALAIYGSNQNRDEDETPIKDKSELVAALDTAIQEATAFAADHGIDIDAIAPTVGFERIALTDDAKEALLENDDTKRRFLSHADKVDRLFKAVLPDEAANAFAPSRGVLHVIAEKLKGHTEPADISEVMSDVTALLDLSVDAEAYIISQPVGGTAHLMDLLRLDFDKLRERFEGGRKRTEADNLRALLSRKLEQLVKVNKTRLDYHEQFKAMIDEWNAGAKNVEAYFQDLLTFAQDLSVEEERHLREGLSEEELSVFDLLTQADLPLGEEDERQVKTLARTLLATLKRDRLQIDWRKYQQSRSAVRVTIEQALDEGLPDAYDIPTFQQAANAVFEHVFELYAGGDQESPLG